MIFEMKVLQAEPNEEFIFTNSFGKKVILARQMSELTKEAGWPMNPGESVAFRPSKDFSILVKVD